MSPFHSIFWPNGRLGVAFSAGKDSTALLALAQKVYSQNDLVALHIDHQARSPESCEAECHAAKAICQQLQIPLINSKLQTGLKSEAEWREARYRELAILGREQKLDWIATAHHAQDQSETILLNLLRGTGLNGLKGMRSNWTLHNQNFCRPLLQIDPKDLYLFLEQENLSAFTDPSNIDPKFKRNQLRLEILPLLEKFQPGALTRLSQLGTSIEKILDWHETELEKVTTEIQPETRREHEIAFNRQQLRQLPAALLDMWCHEQLCELAKGASKITRHHVEELAKFIVSEQLGYFEHVFPGEIQVRGQKKKVVFKNLNFET